MFDSLTTRLASAFSALRGTSELSEENIEQGLGAVRSALLEADVHVKVARDFTEQVRARVLGVMLIQEDVVESVVEEVRLVSVARVGSGSRQAGPDPFPPSLPRSPS